MLLNVEGDAFSLNRTAAIYGHQPGVRRSSVLVQESTCTGTDPSSISSSDDVTGASAVGTGCCAGGDGGQLRVELESGELWNKFDAHCTEMVITKSGR